mmetsp:Transcript_4786/g.20322  ORF Transcript_4786/g.20322 Transcript_4786/m.20322 type:complete len:229 (+) Transcript_4786:1169-1855(+)
MSEQTTLRPTLRPNPSPPPWNTLARRWNARVEKRRRMGACARPPRRRATARVASARRTSRWLASAPSTPRLSTTWILTRRCSPRTLLLTLANLARMPARAATTTCPSPRRRRTTSCASCSWRRRRRCRRRAGSASGCSTRTVPSSRGTGSACRSTRRWSAGWTSPTAAPGRTRAGTSAPGAELPTSAGEGGTRCATAATPRRTSPLRRWARSSRRTARRRPRTPPRRT